MGMIELVTYRKLKPLASHGALQPGSQGKSETPRPVNMGLILSIFLTHFSDLLFR